MKAAIARLASSENLREQSSYDLVLGLVRRPHHSPRPCRHVTPSTPPPPRHHHCTCHRSHHRCNSSRSSDRHSNTMERESRRPTSRSRPSSPSPERTRTRSRSRPSSPPPSKPQTNTQPPQSKSKWSFVKKAKRSASAERSKAIPSSVELGWDDVRPGVMGQWEDTGNNGWGANNWSGDISTDSDSAANTATLAADLCRRATALRRTLYKLPGLINQRSDFLEIIK